MAEPPLIVATGVFKGFTPPSVPSVKISSVEYVQDLQEPGINELGQGGDDGRRRQGEIIPGLFDQVNIRDAGAFTDFAALQDPKLTGPAKYAGNAPPVLRQDRADSWISDEDTAPPQGVFSADPIHRTNSRDHGSKISQLPAKFPGGPKLRIEKPSFSDSSEADESEGDGDVDTDNDEEPDHADSVSRLPPRRPGDPMVRLER